MEELREADRSRKEQQNGASLSQEDRERLEKELDRRYGVTAVRLPRSWNPITRLYEFFLDLYSP